MDKATLKKRVRSSISYFKHTLFPILVYGAGVGLVTGALIWAYTLAVEFVCEKSREVYLFVQSNPLFSPLLFIGLLLLATLSWLNIRRTPEVSGSGVPFSEGVMRGLLPMKWYKVLPSMIFGSLLSFIGGLPLGSEGPSVLIGACVGNAVNDVGRKSNLTRY
ncbi:MAG: chloride channel protein, partial [Clostridia bacterium]|nr:chloride channel protein [Clostridia bacterium]